MKKGAHPSAVTMLRWLAGVLTCVCINAQAATFNVTESSCTGGAGTLVQAVTDANANPGADIINIAPGLSILANCDMIPAPDDDPVELLITDSVTIQGNGSELVGSNGFFQQGFFTSLDYKRCPRGNKDVLETHLDYTAFQVGERNVDNTGIEFTLENFTVKNVSQLANIRDKVKATFREVSAVDVRDQEKCNRPAVKGFGTTDITLERFTITQYTNYEPYTVVPNGVIVGSGSLAIYDSVFIDNRLNYAVVWGAPGSGSSVDIVSSSFANSGALSITNANSSIVNSLFYFQRSINIEATDLFVITDGTAKLTASTIWYEVLDCPPSSNWVCPGDSTVLKKDAIQAFDATVEFQESVLHVFRVDSNSDPSPFLAEYGSGDITADALTFIRPTQWQDATALQAITGQPALLTGTDALPISPANVAPYPSLVYPIITGSATLVNRVTDAGSGGVNELFDDRGNSITKDVLGAPRTAGALRSIGAVQNDVVPNLTAVIDPNVPTTADLFWNQPLSTGITGYDLCLGTGTPPTAIERTLDPCPGSLVEPFTTSATDTVKAYKNLPADNLEHWFAVRAVAGTNKEPWSNIRSVVVPITISYPSTVLTGNTSVSPVIIGPQSVTGVGYFVSIGTLPTGLSLDSGSGVISGTARGSCQSTSVVIAVVLASGAIVQVPVLFTCPPPTPVPTTPAPYLLLLAVLLVLTAVRRQRSTA